MRKNGLLSLAFHTVFILFILAPLVAVMAVSFTDKGYLSLPTDGLSLRWFRTILDYPASSTRFGPASISASPPRPSRLPSPFPPPSRSVATSSKDGTLSPPFFFHPS